MTFISKGTRLLSSNVPDDLQNFGNISRTLRNFSDSADFRSWSCSAFARHEYLMELLNSSNEVKNKQPDVPKDDQGEVKRLEHDSTKLEGAQENFLLSRIQDAGDAPEREVTIEITTKDSRRWPQRETGVPPMEDDEALKLRYENKYLQQQLRDRDADIKRLVRYLKEYKEREKQRQAEEYENKRSCVCRLYHTRGR